MKLVESQNPNCENHGETTKYLSCRCMLLCFYFIAFEHDEETSLYVPVPGFLYKDGDTFDSSDCLLFRISKKRQASKELLLTNPDFLCK